MEDRCDVIIIGAGVIGCAVARELCAYDLSVRVVEKGSYLSSGQSKGNGAIIHGGHDPEPGTLKATLNVAGNAALAGLCSSLGVSFNRTGIYVIAFDDREIAMLKGFHHRALGNGVPGACLVGREEILRNEPNLNPAARVALSVPSGGVVDVFRLVIALAEQAAVNGVRFCFDTEVTALLVEGDSVVGVRTPGGPLRAQLVINCAGVEADRIMRMAGLQNFTITPRRGEYYILDKDYGLHVTRPCFPVPTPAGKGILIFPTVDGNVIVGGDSVPIDRRDDTVTTDEGFETVRHSVLRLVPGLDLSRIITSFAGVRAIGNSDDFLIEAPEQIGGLINVAGIASPGLSAAPAIASRVLEIVRAHLDLQEKPGSRREYRLKPLFCQLDLDGQERALGQDRRYGNVVCRCEQITEGDIYDALHAPLPVRTLEGIKFRTRAGLGRCQGAFDLSRILQIMSRELGVPPAAITRNGPGSHVVVGNTQRKSSDG